MGADVTGERGVLVVFEDGARGLFVVGRGATFRGATSRGVAAGRGATARGVAVAGLDVLGLRVVFDVDFFLSSFEDLTVLELFAGC